MIIEKINNQTIKCTLLKSDMEEFHVDLTDLSYENADADALLRYLMDLAYQKYGFSTNHSPVLVEVIPTPEEGIILFVTRTDASPDMEDLEEYESETEDEEEAPVKKPSIEEILKNYAPNRNPSSDNPGHGNTPKKLLFIANFYGLNTIFQFAQNLQSIDIISDSALYRIPKDNSYYLVLKVKYNKLQLLELSNYINEYSTLLNASHMMENFLKEHAIVISEHNALEFIKNL